MRRRLDHNEIHLVESLTDSGRITGKDLKPKRFLTNAKIPETGIYKVFHSAHRLPHEVTLLEAQFFPTCSRCGTAVEFELFRPALDIHRDPSFRVCLHSLPVLESGGDSVLMAS